MTSPEGSIPSKNLEIDGGNESERNPLVAMIETGIGIGTGTAIGTEIPAIGEVIDTTTPAIEIGIDGMTHLIEIERGVVIGATTPAAVQGGMIQGIGGLMRGTDDLMRGIDAGMILPENFCPLALLVRRGMDDHDLSIHLFRYPRLNRFVRRLPPPRRLQREHRHQQSAWPMRQETPDQTM